MKDELREHRCTGLEESFHAPDARAWVGNQGVAPSKAYHKNGNMQFKSNLKASQVEVHLLKGLQLLLKKSK